MHKSKAGPVRSFGGSGSKPRAAAGARRAAAFASPSPKKQPGQRTESAAGGTKAGDAGAPRRLRLKVRVPEQAPGQIPLLAGMAICAAAGCIGEVVTNPIEVVRTRLQCQKADNPLYAGSVDCFKKILTKEGVGAFGAGLGVSLGLECVQTPLSLGLIDPLLKAACNGDVKRAPLVKRITVAAFCGMLSSLVVYPLDTIKMKAQMVHPGGAGGASASASASSAASPVGRVLVAAREALSDVPGLYRGCRTSALKAAAACAIGTTTYQTVRNALEEASVFREGAGALDMSSAFASTAAVVCTLNPMDIIRMRQYDSSSGGFLQELGKLLREGGPGALWAGVLTSVCVAAPDRMITYFYMEKFRRAYRAGEPERRARRLARAAFDAIDANRDGRLVPSELRDAFMAAHPLGPLGGDGRRMDEDEYAAFLDEAVAGMMREADRDRDGSLSREEGASVAHRLADLVTRKEQRAAFELLDRNKSGHLTRDEILAALRHMAPRHMQASPWGPWHVSQENYERALEREVASLLRHADTDRDGRVSFPEFQRVVERVDECLHGRALAAWARHSGLSVADY